MEIKIARQSKPKESRRKERVTHRKALDGKQHAIKNSRSPTGLRPCGIGMGGEPRDRPPCIFGHLVYDQRSLADLWEFDKFGKIVGARVYKEFLQTDEHKEKQLHRKPSKRCEREDRDREYEATSMRRYSAVRN